MWDDFTLLLNAKSKDFVLKVCHESMNEDKKRETLEIITSTLGCCESQTSSLLENLEKFIVTLIQKDLSTSEDIIPIFPEDFHKSLASLLTKIMVEMLPLWRSNLRESQVSLPKLSSFSWSVSTQQNTDTQQKTPQNTPLCFLNLNIKHKSGVQSVNAHLTSESLASLVAGLKQIKGQINQLTS